MAGKSNKSKSKGKSKVSVGASENHVEGLVEDNGAPAAENLDANISDLNEQDTKEEEAASEMQDCDSTSNLDMDATENSALKNAETGDNADNLESNKSEGHAEGQLQLYPMAVKGPSGEHVELQVNPVDSVMDLRQFLLDAPETCFYTCYDLVLRAKDGTNHHLADFYEIGDVADVTSGGCILEMVNAVYDDRSVRTHVRRTRELLSTSSVHSSFSTALAMENDMKNKADSGLPKAEAPELEGLGFMEDPAGQLENLVASPSLQEISCIESIAFSSFNPVPGYRRLLGDLIYLDILTLEGKSFSVTAHTRGFFVNASVGSIFEPRAAHPPREATTLVGLLRQLSERFSKGFLEVLERKAQGHPFENVPSLLPCSPWLGLYPPPVHKRDVARAEDALTLPYGSETIGMQRDWNEELQSCREFPRKTLQDRIMRDRALYKVNCDFADAAMKGAKGVIGRCIPPINPTDPERFHMYVHNNIFFSFAMDGDFTLMQQMHEQGPKEASNGDIKETLNGEVNDVLKAADDDESLSKKVDETISNMEQRDIQKETSATTADSEGNTSLQAVDSEQATYASANNDLKGTKAYNNADVPGLYTLAMAIIDYRGHRIVAQSIIPGILQGDKSESLLYGSVDNGKKIFWNEKFHSKVLEAGKLLHIKEHEVFDGSGAAVKMAAPVECKGIIGSDDRHYILDLMRTTPRDANYTGQGFRHAVLRPELVAAFCQAEAMAKAKGKEDELEGDEKSLAQVDLLSVRLNPNVLTEFKLAGEPEEIAGDEEAVRKAGRYLLETVLPKFVQDLSSLEVSPMDGQTLTEALHAHGINMRYLGQVANLSKHLPHIWDLCLVEMITRTVKHVLKGILRATQDHDVGGAIAHFFNCYIGHDISSGALSTSSEKSPENPPNQSSGKGGSFEKGKKKGKGGKKSVDSSASANVQITGLVKDDTGSQASYLCVNSELIWKDIQEAVKFKYQFDLPDDALSKVKKISSIRNICQKVGVTLAARKYDFDAPIPFGTSDILDLHAVVKHSVPMCADARDLLESGKLRLAQGKLPEAYELFSEGFSVLQQVCGPMHREVANCCRYLAMVLYHAGDMAGAIMQQHKELIINERCLGLDHPDTAHSYGNMALFYHGLNQTELALRHMARALLLLNVSSGSDHPDVAATFINVAMMYQDIQRMNVALRYLQEALQKNLRLLGEEHIQTAVCYHALAIVFNCIGAYKLSLQHERSTYNILAKQLGEDDTRTRDSANWLKTFQQREVQAKNAPTMTMAAAQKAADVLKARPDLLQAFQVAAATGGGSRGVLNKAAAAAAAAALMGERDNLPRSRGLDERGARAKADVRKRAAAKGVNIRPQSVPMQALPELLNLPSNSQRKKRAEDPSSSAPAGNKEEKLQQDENDRNGASRDDTGLESIPVRPEKANDSSTSSQTPLGLGTGLGALDTKKSKQKSKASKAAAS
ncbi:hypothetical protein L7F22_062531 [Adiantum nelumboides]|nr:hypothetical protein [Adiantum nelumboides]